MTQTLTQTTPTRIMAAMLTNTMSKMTKNIQVGVAMTISGHVGLNLKCVQSVPNALLIADGTQTDSTCECTYL